MNRLITIAAALLAFAPLVAGAQTIAPVYQGQDGQSKEAIGTFCVGSTCASGGGAATPTGTAGSPNAAVVSVQGVAGGTNQNVAVQSSALPAGAATEATLSGLSGKVPASLGTKAAAASLSVTPSSDGLFNALQQTSAAAAAGVAPVASSAASGGVVVKASAGNLYGLNVATGATAGVVQVLNATAIPADGTIAPAKCYYLAANQSLDLNLRAAPLYLSTGVVVVFSSGSSCFTKAASATAFISGDAR